MALANLPSQKGQIRCKKMSFTEIELRLLCLKIFLILKVDFLTKFILRIKVRLIIVEQVIAFVTNVLRDSSFLVCDTFVIAHAETEFFLVDSTFVIWGGQKFVFG